MEIIVLAMLALAWFYSDELISFMQLDRAHRMANRALDRYENESVRNDVEYYSSKKNQISDEQIMEAMAEKARLKKFRDL